VLEIRREVRSQKLWHLSDVIRDGLKELGIALEDKKEGTSWKKM
jgi:cysteinyl-tRNA synthetase